MKMIPYWIYLILFLIIFAIVGIILLKRRSMDKEYQGVLTSIRNFQPSMWYENERPFQAELQGWLKHDFDSKMEVQTGSSRPDMSIHKIAIEVKGPTGSSELQTIADKCVRYYQYYKYAIFVLFDPTYNQKYFSDWKAGIKAHFPKAQIIEIEKK